MDIDHLVGLKLAGESQYVTDVAVPCNRYSGCGTGCGAGVVGVIVA
jgi:hypothetical protein